MPSSQPPSPAITKSGILTDPSTRESYIPSSVRADGTTRREIKVRPGYRPPEDVEVYKNRTAEAWKSRGKGGIPGAAGLNDDENKNDNSGGGAASEKSRRRREARKRAKEAEEKAAAYANGVAESDKAREDAATMKKGQEKNGAKEMSDVSAPAADEEAEAEKKGRNLKKKLRQARELREKKDKGEDLLPEQFEKVIKIQELIRQLEALGFDADGNKKTD